MTEVTTWAWASEGRRSPARRTNALAPATLATSALQASPRLYRGSWSREVRFLAHTHQQAATAAPRTAITDAVEAQYNQVGPTGCPQAADELPASRVRARRPSPGLTPGTG